MIYLQYFTQILEPIPLLPLSMLFASIWDSFLVQASMLLRCQYTATLSREGGAWFISIRWNIPEFPEIFPGIESVSIIYVRYCRWDLFSENLFWLSRSATGKISRQYLYEFFVKLAVHYNRSSLGKKGCAFSFVEIWSVFCLYLQSGFRMFSLNLAALIQVSI